MPYVLRKFHRTRPRPADEDEPHFQARVIRLARLLGWREYHTLDSRGSAPGFPDLILVSARQRRLIFAELKSEGGVVSAAQRVWLAESEAAHPDTYLWRPRDWARIVETLTGEAASS